MGAVNRLDLFVVDEDGVAYDIEMQMDNSYKKYLGKRSRYYVSLMDNGALKKDEPYSHLRKSYVIFICTFDPFGKGLAKIFTTSVQNERGQVRHVPKENLCCTSVLSESRAVRRSESLASVRYNEERERVFYGYCRCLSLFMSEQSADYIF